MSEFSAENSAPWALATGTSGLVALFSLWLGEIQHTPQPFPLTAFFDGSAPNAYDSADLACIAGAISIYFLFKTLRTEEE